MPYKIIFLNSSAFSHIVGGRYVFMMVSTKGLVESRRKFDLHKNAYLISLDVRVHFGKNLD